MKKKTQLIDNKVIVEGPETNLLKHEVLMQRDSNNKVVLKELIDGTLSTISAGSAGVFDTIISKCVKFYLIDGGESGGTITFSGVPENHFMVKTMHTSNIATTALTRGTGQDLSIIVDADEAFIVGFQDNIDNGTVTGTVTKEITDRDNFESTLSYFISPV